ncbi:hypothetical protein KBY30_04140 [Ruegeria pomeroyi]|nr:hypothetical protein [Ruegeria pomeroyi]
MRIALARCFADFANKHSGRGGKPVLHSNLPGAAGGAQGNRPSRYKGCRLKNAKGETEGARPFCLSIKRLNGSGGRDRTYDQLINSYQLPFPPKASRACTSHHIPLKINDKTILCDLSFHSIVVGIRSMSSY